MKRYFELSLCHLLLCLVLSHPIIADKRSLNCSNQNEKSAFLWSVETDRGTRGYLFGTIHEPFTEIWQYVSQKVKDALESSDSLVLEVDVSNKSKIDALLRCMQMTSGSTVHDYLPNSIYFRLKQYMRRYRHNLIQWYMTKGESRQVAKKHAFDAFANMTTGWERRKPLWLLILLQQLEIKIPDRSPPLDFYLAAHARTNNKDIRTIETTDEQCDPLRTVDTDSIIFAINYTLSYLEFISRKANYVQQPALRSHSELINHYQCGDTNINTIISSRGKHVNRAGFSLGSQMDKKAEQIGKMFYNEIMLQRNIRLAERIIEFLETKENSRHFFALGLGHLVGENSVVSYLKDYGYTVKSIKDADEIHYPQSAWSRKLKKFNELWIRKVPLVRSETTELTVTITEIPSKIPRRFNVYEVFSLLIIIFVTVLDSYYFNF